MYNEFERLGGCYWKFLLSSLAQSPNHKKTPISTAQQQGCTFLEGSLRMQRTAYLKSRDTYLHKRTQIFRKGGIICACVRTLGSGLHYPWFILCGRWWEGSEHIIFFLKAFIERKQLGPMFRIRFPILSQFSKIYENYYLPVRVVWCISSFVAYQPYGIFI